VGPDLIIEPGRLLAVAADLIKGSLGPGKVKSHFARGLGRVGHPGDTVFGQQVEQRGRADKDFLP